MVGFLIGLVVGSLFFGMLWWNERHRRIKAEGVIYAAKGVIQEVVNY